MLILANGERYLVSPNVPNVKVKLPADDGIQTSALVTAMRDFREKYETKE